MPESKVHSFIIKLWMDDDESGQTKWHGYITHVPDGDRRYLQNLEAVISFIESYLGEHTIRGKSATSGRGWLKWWRRKW